MTAADEIYYLGSVIAICVSWSVNHSVLLAILHAALSWVYILYHGVMGFL